MKYGEKKKVVAALLADIEDARSIESLMQLTGQLFFEIFTAFDADRIKLLGNNVELLVQSILIPVAQNIGREKTSEIQREIGIATRDILAMFDDSYISE